MTPPRHVWIVGRTGLLGRALGRAVRAPGTVEFQARLVPWPDPDAAIAVLRDELARFLSGLPDGAPWTVYWAAGAGVIGSAPDVFASENRVVAAFAEALAGSACGGGSFFLASSASVYAGGHGAPFDEGCPALPTSPYARAKLANEEAVAVALAGRVPHVVGRISTLYGPGQNLAKNQGLVSRLALQAALRRPITVFVPLDTLRDYVFADDAAALAVRAVAAAVAQGDRSTRTRNIADGRAMSIGALSALVREVSHRRGGELHVPAPPTGAHVHDLRIDTRFRAEQRGVVRTPAAVGVRAVYDDVFARLVRGELAV